MTAPGAELDDLAGGGEMAGAERVLAAAPAARGDVSLHLGGVRKSFGACRAVDGVSLDVREGELLAILGPSGCGKSTLLRIVAGLERQDAGTVVLHGRDVGNLPPAARGCGVVFQSYALFPNLTAAQNVAFGIDRHRHGRRARGDRAAALLEQVGLAAESGKYPAQLSGGQQQRVALARALATEPTVLLLDEPLSALDAKVRAMLRLEIRRLQQATRLTTLLVTHDQEEAMTMADRVAVMNAGRVAQVDTPRAVYQRPADTFTAAFVGAMNLLDGWEAGAGGKVRRGNLELASTGGSSAPVGARVTVAFRPEEGEIVSPGVRGENVLPCRVERVEFRGAFVRYYLVSSDSKSEISNLKSHTAGPSPLRARGQSPDPLASRGVPGEGEVVLVDSTVRDAGVIDATPGALVGVHVPPESVRVFGGAGVGR